MRRPLILWTSDWHLAPGAWKKAPQIRGDSYFALEQIVDIALKFGVKAVCCAGDLTDDPHPDAVTAWHMRRQLDRLEESGIKVPFVRGQHDGLTGMPWLHAVHDGPHHCHKNMAWVGDLRVYGIDYMNPEDFRRELDEMPDGVDVLMTHQVWKDWIPWRHNAPMLSELKGCKVCVTGDFHRNMTVTTDSGVLVYSPGSSSMQALDEPPEKYVWLMYDDLSMERVALRGRPFHSLVVETPQDLERLVADVSEYRLMYSHTPGDLPEGVRVPIVRVRYADNIPEADARLRAAFAEVHAFVEPFPAGQETVVEVGRDAQNDHALSAAMARLRPDPEDPVRRDVMRLLESPGLAAALADMEAAYKREAAGET